MWLRTPVGGWQLSAVVHLQSGFYYTPTGNNPYILTGSRAADYLNGPLYPANQGPNGWWVRSSFAAPPIYRWGTAGTGILQGPGQQIYNLSLTKFFVMNESRGINLRMRADLINAFNHPNFQGPQTNVSNSDFGSSTSAYPARAIQLGLRLTF